MKCWIIRHAFLIIWLTFVAITVVACNIGPNHNPDLPWYFPR